MQTLFYRGMELVRTASERHSDLVGAVAWQAQVLLVQLLMRVLVAQW
jgi:hypothetical protein